MWGCVHYANKYSNFEEKEPFRCNCMLANSRIRVLPTLTKLMNADNARRQQGEYVRQSVLQRQGEDTHVAPHRAPFEMHTVGEAVVWEPGESMSA